MKTILLGTIILALAVVYAIGQRKIAKRMLEQIDEDEQAQNELTDKPKF